MAKIMDLFEAYESGGLPNDGGYIISNFFDNNSSYTRFEMISYGNVKDIYRNDDGITFQADGLKLFVLVEPPSYSNKHIEPCYRDDAHKIPYRFKEVELYTTKRQQKIMVGKEPVETYTAFTIMNETGVNQSFIIHKADGIVESMKNYFTQVLWKNVNIPKTEAVAAAKMISATFPQLVNPFA